MRNEVSGAQPSPLTTIPRANPDLPVSRDSPDDQAQWSREEQQVRQPSKGAQGFLDASPADADATARPYPDFYLRHPGNADRTSWFNGP